MNKPSKKTNIQNVHSADKAPAGQSAAAAPEKPAPAPAELNMNEIARLAGVSQATVSRVLHGGRNVAADKAEAVLRIAKEQGFTPRARRGRAEGGGNLGFLPTASLGQLCMEHLLRAAQAIAESLPAETGLVWLQPFTSPERLRAVIAGQGLRGLLLAGTAAPRALTPVLGEIPHAWLDPAAGGRDGLGAGRDEQAGALAARELLNAGAERLLALDCPSLDPGARRRLDGFRFEALRQGREAVSLAVAGSAVWETSPAAALRERLRTALEKADFAGAGLFCPDDRLTARLYPLLLAAGTVPGRGTLPFISCNHAAGALAGLNPRPASIDLAPELAARQALARLQAQMAGIQAPARLEVVIRPELVPGETI